jgi:hypothetical protein
MRLTKKEHRRYQVISPDQPGSGPRGDPPALACVSPLFARLAVPMTKSRKINI